MKPTYKIIGFLLLTIFSANTSVSQESSPYHLVFTNLPETVTTGVAIQPAIEVAIQNENGELVTDTNDRIALAVQSESAGVVLEGVTEVQAVNGVATFSDIRVNQVASEIQLVAYEPVQLVGNWQDEKYQTNSITSSSYHPYHEEKQNSPVIAYSDVWGAGDLAFIGRVSTARGMDIIDISNPENPERIVHWKKENGKNNIIDLKVQNGIAYLVSGNGDGVFVLDIQDPGDPILLSEIDETMEGFKIPHNIFVLDDYLYMCDGQTKDVKVFNISDPINPVFVSNIAADSGEDVHDITAQGNRLYFSTIGRTGYTEIYDISDVESGILFIGKFVSGTSTHSNWPTENGNYIAVAQERGDGDLQLFDISDPQEATFASQVHPMFFDGAPYSPHNPLIEGNRLYVAWYSAGLQVFDIQDPEKPRLLGFYDTKPGYPDKNFIGAWGVYPFLGEDRILLSDVETGLYIFDVSELDVEVGISDSISVVESTGIKDSEWLILDNQNILSD